MPHDTNTNIPVILDRFVMGYPRQKRFAWELLPLHEAQVGGNSYKVPILNGDHLKPENFKRAHGAEPKRTNNTFKEWVHIPVNRYTVESAVDDAELAGAIDVVKSTLLMKESRFKYEYDKMLGSIEVEQIESVLDAKKYGDHVYTPSGSDLWDHEDSDVVGQITDARKAIKKKTGLYPNKCVISDAVWEELRFKKNLVDRLPTTTLQSGITPEEFAKIINVKKVVIADNMSMGDDGQLTFIWGDNVLLAYVPEVITNLEQTLAFGVTVRSPLGYAQKRDYYDNRTTSSVTAVDENIGWKVVNYGAGFLFKSVLKKVSK